MPIEIFFGFFLAIIASIMGSMVGIGGGIVISPFLSYLNYTPSQISSTSLMGVLSTSISSSISYYKKKLISNKIGIIISFSSIPGAFIGVFISKLFSLSEFKLYFAFILIATSLYLILKSRINNYKLSNVVDIDFDRNWYNIQPVKLFLLVIFCLIAGILSSSFGIGGGIIFVPILIILLGFNMKQAAATSQFALFFTSLSGLLLYSYYGYPNYPMGFSLSIGSLIGGTIGSKLSSKISSNSLKIIFSLVLIIISIKLFYDEYY